MTTIMLLIYRRGNIHINNTSEEYELSYYEHDEFDKYLVLKVLGTEYFYKLHSDFNANNVALVDVLDNRGGECASFDANNDCYPDILIDIGVRGLMLFRICYVYDEATNSFIFVDGFDMLPFTKFYLTEDTFEYYFISESTSEVGFYRAYRRYIIEGSKISPKSSSVLCVEFLYRFKWRRNT